MAAERSSGRRSSPGSAVHFSPARRQPWARLLPRPSQPGGGDGGGVVLLSYRGAWCGGQDAVRAAPDTREGLTSARPSPDHRERGTFPRPPGVRSRSPGRSFGTLVPLTPWPLQSPLALSLPLQTSASPPGLGAPVPPKAPPDASAPPDRGPRRRRRARPAPRLPLPVTCTREPRSPGEVAGC